MASNEFEDQIVHVPFRDHRLECPACHQPLHVYVTAKIEPGGVRTIGGTVFKTNLAVDVKVVQQKLRVEHECDLKEED